MQLKARLRDLKNIKHKKTRKILLTSSCNGRKHDFKQFKELNKLYQNSKTPTRRKRFGLRFNLTIMSGEVMQEVYCTISRTFME